MTTLQKIKYYIEVHPYEGPPLDSESLLQTLLDYLPSHLIILRFQETNILEEQFIEEKVLELFQEAGRPQELSAFLIYWVQRDDKLFVDCLEWEQMINQLTQNNVGLLETKMATEVANQKQNRARYQRASPNATDEDSIRARLLRLFEFYTKREDRTLQILTFEQMTTHIKKMSLTTWMHFCKDCNLTSLLGKEEVHQAFRKSTIKLLSFEQFQKALSRLLGQVHADNVNDGWKMVGVYDETTLKDKMVALGVPASSGASPPRVMHVRTTNSSIFALPELRSLHIAADKPEPPSKPPKKKRRKSPSELQLESLNLQKLAKLKLDVPVEVEEDADDEMFLGEYKLEKPGAQDLYSTKFKRKKKMQSENNRGIIKRMDQRILKYVRT